MRVFQHGRIQVFGARAAHIPVLLGVGQDGMHPAPAHVPGFLLGDCAAVNCDGGMHVPGAFQVGQRVFLPEGRSDVGQFMHGQRGHVSASSLWHTVPSG